MKRNRIISVILSILVLISFVLTYFLIIDIDAFNRLVSNQSQTEKADEALMDTQTKYSSGNFYQATQQTFEDVVGPSQVIFQENSRTYRVLESNLLDSFQTIFQNDPIEVESDEPEVDHEKLLALYQADHIQFIFPSERLLGLLKESIDYETNDELENFDLDRIFFVTHETEGLEAGSVYLVNSEKDAYLEASLPRETSIESLLEIVHQAEESFINVETYWGSSAILYLPKEALTLKSRLYTLETIPDIVYVNQIFPDSEFTVSQMDSSSRGRVYRTYRHTLEFDYDNERMNFVINRVGSGEYKAEDQKLRDSYLPISKNEYWTEAIYMDKAVNNTVVYRRYLEGFPVIGAPNTIDYGASRTFLRNDASGEVYRYQVPLVILEAHIPDMNEPHELVSGREIVSFLEQQGYRLNMFDDIFIAYEWQSEMEDFKKVTLVPKWYFEYQDNYYSWEQIKDGHLEAAISREGTNPTGEGVSD